MIIDIIRTTKIVEVRIGPRGRPGSDGSSAWADITGKPSTFPPSSHTHAQSEVTGLEAALAGKAASVHTHVIADTTGLQSALDGKAATSHTHNQSDVTGLTSALAAKADLVDGMVPTAQIPAIAITEFLGTVANQSAMLALTGQRGDWCNRSDVSKAFVLVAEPASTLANWAAIDYPAAPILSVNGQTGTVVLGKDDIGLGNVSNALQLIAANNLSDLTNAGTARVNLGLGTLATQNATIADYLTIATAASTYQPLFTAGTGVLTNNGSNVWSYTATSSGGNTFGLDAGKIAVYSDSGEFTAASAIRLTSGPTVMGVWFGSDRLAKASTTFARTWTLPDQTGTIALRGANTFTALQSFSGTDHAGLQLNNLTTTQRDALTGAAGMVIWNTTDGRMQLHNGTSWTSGMVRLSGDTMTGALVNSTNGAASTPALQLTGTTFSGGTSTTTKPHLLIEPAGTTSNNWGTDGTMLGVNAANTPVTRKLISLQRSAVEYFSVDGSGNVILGNQARSATFHAYTSLSSAISTIVANRSLLMGPDVTGIRMASGYQVGWSSSGAGSGDAFSNVDLTLSRAGVGILGIEGSSTGGALRLREMTAPSAPAADRAHLWIEDNGSGKTRLMIQFQSGTAQQIAIEP